jgi:hypothetical protein
MQRVRDRLEVKRSSIIPDLMAELNAPLSIPLIKQAADGISHALGHTPKK